MIVNADVTTELAERYQMDMKTFVCLCGELLNGRPRNWTNADVLQNDLKTTQLSCSIDKIGDNLRGCCSNSPFSTANKAIALPVACPASEHRTHHPFFAFAKSPSDSWGHQLHPSKGRAYQQFASPVSEPMFGCSRSRPNRADQMS